MDSLLEKAGQITMKKSGLKNFSYSFDLDACKECGGKCCTGLPGNIWVNAEEVKAIAVHLGLNVIDTMGKFLIRIGNRWSLQERYQDGQHVCVFFDLQDKKCKVYPARPCQCRKFPFWSYYRDRVDELISECPGVNMEGQ